jgi:septum site-determining protein MinD
MTRVISVISGKGGVGKTTIVANLGVVLAEMGIDITVIDCNLTTPNLGFHLGMPIFPKNLHDILKGREKISDVIYEHDSGLKIIPAGIGIDDLKGVDPRRLSNALLGIYGTTDIVIIDAAAGLGREAMAAIENSDELLIVTNPELPAVLDAVKAYKIAENIGIKAFGVVLNRITGKKHELNEYEITNLIELPIVAKIREDENIKKSIAMRIPIVKYKPYSKTSYEIKMLAAKIAGKPFELKIPWYRRFFGVFFD